MQSDCKKCGGKECLNDFNISSMLDPFAYPVMVTSWGSYTIAEALNAWGIIKKATIKKCSQCESKFSQCPYCNELNDFFFRRMRKCNNCKKRFYNFLK